MVRAWMAAGAKFLLDALHNLAVIGRHTLKLMAILEQAVLVLSINWFVQVNVIVSVPFDRL